MARITGSDGFSSVRIAGPAERSVRWRTVMGLLSATEIYQAHSWQMRSLPRWVAR